MFVEKLRRLAGALCLDLALDCLLVTDVDLDLLRLRLGALRQIDLQNTIYIFRVDVIRIDGVRQSERTGKRTVAALNAMEVLFLLFSFELALATDGQRVVLITDIDVLLVNSGNLELQTDLVLVFINVNGGNEISCRQQLILPLSPIEILEQGVNTIVERCQLTKRVPTSNNHFYLLVYASKLFASHWMLY